LSIGREGKNCRRQRGSNDFKFHTDTTSLQNGNHAYQRTIFVQLAFLMNQIWPLYEQSFG
jgi:hypothetical protein